MLFRVKERNDNDSVLGGKFPSVTAIAAGIAMFAVVSSAPVTVSLDETVFDLITSADAYAAKGGNGKGGGRGGGNGGGRGGGTGGGTDGGVGGGGGDGQSNGGGNNGGGNNGGGNNGGGNNNGGGSNGGSGQGTSSSRDRGGEQRSRLPTEPTVAIAVFTTAIKKRYPANDIELLDDPHQAVSFFSELHAMAGKKITHRWIHNGSVVYEANFDVLAQRWRIWSTQVLPADKAGTWRVEVVDEGNKVLQTSRLNYRPVG